MRQLWVVLVLLAVTVSGCSQKLVAPQAQADLFADCRQGTWFLDPECFYSKGDTYGRGPVSGLLGRRVLSAGGAEIGTLNLEHRATWEVIGPVDNAETQPVWVPSHRAINYDLGARQLSIVGAWSDGQYAILTTFAFEMPSASMWNPMWSADGGQYAHLFRWRDPRGGDTTLTSIVINNQHFNLGANGNPYHARISRNGDRIVCQTTADGSIYVVSVANGTSTRVTGRNTVSRDPAISPDGQEVACVTHVSSHAQALTLVRLDATGQSVTTVTVTVAEDAQIFSPVFSTDGKTLIWIEAHRDGDWRLYTSSVANPSVDRFVPIPPGITWLDWR